MSAEPLDDTGPFAQGIAVGMAISAVIVHIAYVALGVDWTNLYRDLGGPLPLMTRVTISAPWQLGVPVVGAILIGALVVRRPRSFAPYAAVTAVLLVAAACTYWFPSMPLTMLTNAIKE
jgi:hypothetical protein